MAAGLSIHSRLAGTASGLMGFLQIAIAAGGSFIVALLPQDSALVRSLGLRRLCLTSAGVRALCRA